MIALLAAMFLVQEKGDADRVRVANLMEQAFKAQGLPRKLGKDHIQVRGMIVDDGDLQKFAEKHGPENGAVLVVSTTGTLWALAGGTRGDEGVPVAFFGRREGILLVTGGAHKASQGAAEALETQGASGEDRGGGISLGDNSVVRVARGHTPRRSPTGEGPPPAPEPLSVKGADTLQKDLESLAEAWARATKPECRELAEKLAAAHRPTAGVLACVSKDGRFLVMIGADGTDARPDGVGVQVAGKPGGTVVLIPGRAAKGGKAGTAKGAGAFIVD
jgi:hypothetical protein